MVKCHDNNMTLTVRRRGVGQLLLYPGEATAQSQHLISTLGRMTELNTFWSQKYVKCTLNVCMQNVFNVMLLLVTAHNCLFLAFTTHYF